MYKQELGDQCGDLSYFTGSSADPLMGLRRSSAKHTPHALAQRVLELHQHPAVVPYLLLGLHNTLTYSCYASKALLIHTTKQAHLAQADEQVKDVGVVVDHGAGLNIGSELRLALRVQRLIEIGLALVKSVLAHHHRPVPQHAV